MFLGNYYGSGSGPIWNVNPSCLGNETSLAECGRGFPEFGCDHSHDVSIVCDDGTGNC